MRTLDEIIIESYENSKSKGFWDELDPRKVNVRLMKLALICSEVGEAVEAVRDENNENFVEELADIVIRVSDLAEACGLALEEAIIQKQDYNRGRPYMHARKA